MYDLLVCVDVHEAIVLGLSGALTVVLVSAAVALMTEPKT
jgi:hypothetical protein